MHLHSRISKSDSNHPERPLLDRGKVWQLSPSQRLLWLVDSITMINTTQPCLAHAQAVAVYTHTNSSLVRRMQLFRLHLTEWQISFKEVLREASNTRLHLLQKQHSIWSMLKQRSEKVRAVGVKGRISCGPIVSCIGRKSLRKQQSKPRSIRS